MNYKTVVSKTDSINAELQAVIIFHYRSGPTERKCSFSAPLSMHLSLGPLDNCSTIIILAHVNMN